MGVFLLGLLEHLLANEMDTESSKSKWTAQNKRNEQLKKWVHSDTDLQSSTLKNANPLVKFNEGAVFLAACSSGDLDEVEALLDAGADINGANVDGLTALHQACIDENLEVCKFLVRKGIQIDQQDNEGWTPLHATSSCGFFDIARFLVRSGANVVTVNSEGEVPADLADDEMREYLEKEARLQGLNADQVKNEERESMLADARIYLNSVNNNDQNNKLQFVKHANTGASAMHVAAAKGYDDVLKILIHAGLDINERDNDLWTPLHAASHWGHKEAAKILADKGVDFTLKSRLGQTPCDVADDEMVKYMERLEISQTVETTNDKKDVIKTSDRYGSRNPTTHTHDFSSLRNRQHNDNESVTSSSSSDEGDDDNSSTASSASDIVTIKGIKSTTTNNKLSSSSSGTNLNVTPFATRRTQRPASIHVSSPGQIKGERFESSASARRVAGTDGNKPTLAVQPSERGGGKDGDEAPSSWRSGLRKTGSFEEKRQNITPRITTTNTSSAHQGEGDRLKRQSDGVKDNAAAVTGRTARVAPLLDSRGYSRTRFTSDDTQNASGNVGVGSTTRKNDFTSSVDKSVDNEEPSLTSLSNLPDKKQDRRRSHLQPVRDEEAEAQRKARSRRERQARRSTQGVTLDVYEEAKRHITSMREERDKANNQHTNARTSQNYPDPSSDNYDSKSANGSSSGFYRRRPHDSGSAPQTSVNMPASYIPQQERVRENPTSTATTTSIHHDKQQENVSSLTSTATVTAAAATEEDRAASTTSSSSSSATSASQTRAKSLQQSRRRQRNQRRSTGIDKTDMHLLEDRQNKTADQDTEVNQQQQSRLSSATTDRERTSSLSKRSGDPTADTTGNSASAQLRNSRNRGTDHHDDKDFKKLYGEECSETERLKKELKKAQMLASELELKLQESEQSQRRNEKHEQMLHGAKLAELEMELVGLNDLRSDNQRLKDENGALIRVISKLSK